MNKVKHYRELKGWSQKKLALESGISRQSIIDIESGKRKTITSTTMKKIANALDKTVTTIFCI